ncbi:ABC transporter ATP-binding protein [Alkalilacustris brevis]|uniref:ABC transporter ATP-binding protein n=1 Tax=Alkalilacustris brevis TaxID=2026338 RepID=UPI000E0D66D6|nr:ATP-binding cassette domain-containing protein [Alkalilacustris brevis]
MSAAPGITLEGRALIAGAPLFGPLRLEMTAGRWTCLLGASGAGKTTLLRLLAGLECAAVLEGQITTSDGAALAGRVGYMGQSDLLLPWADVLGNVTLGARLRGQRPDRDRARALIARVGLEGHIHQRPAQLSGGQRQRAALARTLMEDRPVVLLDEAFSALDTRTRVEMQALAAETLQGRTVLMVTHDPLEAARMADAAWLLTDAGTLEALPLPESAAPRALDDAATLTAQAQLFARLRRAAVA